jgi:hypothetical protein
MNLSSGKYVIYFNIGDKMDKAIFQKLFIKLFSSRQIAHNEHLKTDLHSAHVALQEYYEGILDLTDDLIETYQGQFGLIDPIDDLFLNCEDIVEYLSAFALEINNLSVKIPAQGQHLSNIMQEITALMYKTLYKLKYLK